MDKQTIFPFLVLAVLVPLMISPTTMINGFESSEGQIQVLIEFESPKNFQALKNDVERDLFGKFNAVGNNFKNQGNYTSFQGGNFTTPTDADEIVFDLGQGSGNSKLYQMKPEIRYVGNSDMTDSEFMMVYNTQVALLRIDVINFLEDNNATPLKSYLTFTYGEVELDEQQ